MRSRKHRRQAQALLFSLGSVGFALIATFFFYDGPITLPRMEASAQAIEPTADAETMSNLQSEKANTTPLTGLLPDGFKAQWTQAKLDHGQVALKMLSHPFSLSQTWHQTGSEAYQYASYLFEQMAHNMKNPELAARLQALSLQAQTIGNAVHQASDLQYAGPPTEDMTHLQVRSAILSHLVTLNPNALITLRYNQNGKLLTADKPKDTNRGVGEDIQALMSKTQAVLNHPSAGQYPQTMQLVRQESELLKAMASHLTLRWESTLYCQHSSCDALATYIRVYTQQTLPETTLAAVTVH
jgi:hypothetical protein